MLQNTYTQDPLLAPFDSNSSLFDSDATPHRDFGVSSLRVLSVSPSSRACKHPRNFDLFDFRSDQRLFRSQSAVAVLLEIKNLKALDATSPGIHATFRIVMTDETTGMEIHNSYHGVRIGNRFPSKLWRYDIPLPYSKIAPDHDYRISVVDFNSDKTICSRTIRFFDITTIRMLPNKWFRATYARFYYCRSLNFKGEFDHHLISIRFSMNTKCIPVRQRLPELNVRLHLPNGKKIDYYLVTENVSSSGDLTKVGLECCFDEESAVQRGCYIYVELRCLDVAFTGFIARVNSSFVEEEFHDPRLTTMEPAYTLLRMEKEYERVDALAKSSSKDLFSKEEFDKLLDEFIDSQSIDTNADAEPESDAEPDSDAELDSDVAYTVEEAHDTSDFCREEASDQQSAFESLDSLTGIREVKEKIEQQTTLRKYLSLRRDAGLPVPSMPLHALFLGSPGTGKTTVGKLLGSLMKGAGALSKGHVVFRERATLLGQYYSSECEKTREALDEAQGGILFIDEAYQLFQPEDPRDPGKFVLETLMTALADTENRDWMLVLSGYPRPLLEMIRQNPGLSSRIPESNHYHFEDFTAEELVQIAVNKLSEYGFTLSQGAVGKLQMTIERDWRHRDENFGNARYITNMIETEIIPSVAKRVMPLLAPSSASGLPSGFNLPSATPIPTDLLTTIQESDIPASR